MSYYRRFRIILDTPIFRRYLRWCYDRGIKDLSQLNFVPNIRKPNFTALLCGVGHESSADVFISFVTKLNPSASIVIIDLGAEQVEAVKKLVAAKYPNRTVRVIQTDALDLEKFIKTKSVDWIETDWLFAFFNQDSLKKLLGVWYRLLSDEGFITTRCGGDQNWLDRLITKAVVWIGKIWLGVSLYQHDRQAVELLMNQTGFRWTGHSMGIPTARRYSLRLRTSN